jgi:glyoxylase-like metal-dependent hydrolase (beta-lactamase superfamily II)
MARLDQVHPANVDGDWFVDARCIDCEACRLLAPEVFVRRSGQSVVGAQPAGADDPSAWRAALSCPTQSIGTRTRHPRPRAADLLPVEVEDGSGVSYCGYNSEDSYGANAFFAERPAGNVLVDSPRFTRRLAGPLAERGGVDHVLLTHRDDVADAERWARHFGARVWVHEDDADAAPFATDVVAGAGPVEVQPGLVLVPVPGHTRGSVAYVLDERFLFSGDSLAFDGEGDRADLTAYRDVCWYSWDEQRASLARLAAGHRFEWVLPGHGGRGRRPADEMHDRLVALTHRMAR